MFGLGRRHVNSPLLKVDIGPAQAQRLGWGAQPAKPRQGEDQTPLGIWAGRRDFRGHVPRYEVLAGRIASHVGFDAGKGVVSDDPFPAGEAKQLLGPAQQTPRRVDRQPTAQQVQPVFVGVAFADAGQGPIRPKECDQVAAGLPQPDQGIASAKNI
jgi:hypothetical protein